MTKARVTWVNLRAWLACSLLCVVAGCGKTNTTESGETHFVTCSSNDDCEGLSGAPTCRGGFCRDENGNRVPDTNDTNGTDVPDGPKACRACSSECAAPGDCSLASACDVVACGSAMVDENACLRPTCVEDRDCPDDERCLSDYWSRKYECQQQASSCNCQSGLGLFPVHVCSPTALVGARGEWQKLVVDDTVIGDSTVHTLLPDGSVSIQGRDEQGQPIDATKQLSSEDVDELERTINGALLRPALAEPTACPMTKERDVIVQLYLDGATLEKNVAGCLGGADEQPIFTSLMALISRY